MTFLRGFWERVIDARSAHAMRFQASLITITFNSTVGIVTMAKRAREAPNHQHSDAALELITAEGFAADEKQGDAARGYWATIIAENLAERRDTAWHCLQCQASGHNDGATKAGSSNCRAVLR